jgi:hypothetical protein
MTETATTTTTDITQDYVYVAEYLQRIGTISLIISLQPAFSASHIQFPDKPSRTINLVYSQSRRDHKSPAPEEHSSPIDLPVEFASRFAGTQRKLSGGCTELLSIRTDPQQDLNKQLNEKLSFLDDGQDSNPWSIKQLKKFETKSKNDSSITSTAHFQCKCCKSKLISLEIIATWKALPSETWAEMMDFWHCHKPSDDDGHNHSHVHSNSDVFDSKTATAAASAPLFNPSYAVSSFEAYPSTALVGLSYILFHRSHFVPESFSELSDIDGARYPLLTCRSCNAWLGYATSRQTFRVFKWNLTLVSNTLLLPSSYPEYLFLSATIAELISSHGIYTFSLLEEDYEIGTKSLKADDQELALIWIFNPDIQYCTNANNRPPTALESGITTTTERGFKVFYSIDPTVIPELKQTRGDIEQLYFPGKVIDSILTHLDNHSKLYPPEVKTLGNKNWNVSILDRLK